MAGICMSNYNEHSKKNSNRLPCNVTRRGQYMFQSTLGTFWREAIAWGFFRQLWYAIMHFLFYFSRLRSWLKRFRVLARHPQETLIQHLCESDPVRYGARRRMFQQQMGRQLCCGILTGDLTKFLVLQPYKRLFLPLVDAVLSFLYGAVFIRFTWCLLAFRNHLALCGW